MIYISDDLSSDHIFSSDMSSTRVVVALSPSYLWDMKCRKALYEVKKQR